MKMKELTDKIDYEELSQMMTYILIFSTILIFVHFGGNFLNKKIRVYNQDVRPHLKETSSPIYQLDHSLYPILSDIDKNNFDWGTSDLKKLETYSFRNLDKFKKELLPYRIKKDSDKELSLVKLYLDKGGHQETLLDYINEVYLAYALEQLRNNEFGELRYNISMAYQIYNLLDPSPIDVSAFRQRIINKILLYNCLLNDPRLMFKKDVHYELFRLIDQQFDIEKISSFEAKYEKDKTIFEYLLYAKGVNKFRKKEYKEAKSLFKKVVINSKNTPFINLSNLMLARCIFWEYERNKNKTTRDKNKATLELVILKKKIFRNSYKQDILIYKSIIEEKDFLSRDEKLSRQLEKLSFYELENFEKLIKTLKNK